MGVVVMNVSKVYATIFNLLLVGPGTDHACNHSILIDSDSDSDSDKLTNHNVACSHDASSRFSLC